MHDERDIARRILVVDDTESIHNDFRAVLMEPCIDTTALDTAEAAIFGHAASPSKTRTRNRYDLDCVFQGKKALKRVRQALCEKRPYQLAFVDMRMPPGWDGLKTIEEIWRVDPDIQVVICTAHSDYSWDAIVSRLGNSDKLLILKKPFDNVEVEQLAEALTKKWQLARAVEARLNELEQVVSERTQELETTNRQLTREVTERRTAEERFRSFVENVNDIIFCLSVEGGFTYVSPKWPAVLGHEMAEVLGHPLLRFVHQDDVGPCKQMLQAIAETGRKEEGLELRMLHRDGDWRWCTLSAAPLKDSAGEVTAIVGIAHDTTRRRQANEELQRTQQELQQILSAATPLCVIDTNYDIRMLNDTFCSLFGLSLGEATGKKCYELMDFSKCHTPQCPIRNVMEAPRVCQYEVSRQNENGEETVCLATATPYFNMDYSAVIGVVVNFVDITARKQAEKEIAEANRKLEQANRELKEMQSQVVQNEKLASIGQLAAGVAHEMNTPVGFVASNFQTLQSYMSKFMKLFELYESLTKAVEDGDRDSRLECMQGINQSREKMKIDFILGDLEELFSESKEGLERVTDIIQNLRDFSRVDQSEDCDEYDLNEGIKTTLIVARNELKYDVDIDLQLSDLPQIACHSGQINQVFLNILVNAAQAIKSQERGEKGHVGIRTHATETHVVCEITDDGPGIPETVLSKVFDPFFTTKPPGKGTGLGLSVSYDIVVTKHKGELIVDSQPEKGTTFIVKLPIQGITPSKGKELPNEEENCAVCR